MSEPTPDLVRYEVSDGVAVVTVDNPPVNVLSPGVPQGLMASLRRAGEDPAVTAVVVTGAGRHFIAGADIKMFDAPPGEQVDLNDMLAVFDDCPKPVVAALKGSVLGGGLEVAMACHARVADRTASLGMPEVNLGILPGAGGTQRLPRLVGVTTAVDMITGGAPIDAGRAHAAGLVDGITDGDVLAAASEHARALAAGGTLRRTRDLQVASGTDEPVAAVIAAARERTAARARGRIAPLRCVDAVEAAATRPFDEGLRVEKDLFVELVLSEQSAALRHVFFAERKASKVDDLGPDVQAVDVRRAVVLGAGTMGAGIAMAFANAGIEVTVVDVDDAAVGRGRERVEAAYAATVAKGRLSAEDRDARLGRIAFSSDQAAAVGDADLVVEAVFEDMAVKKEIFGRLDVEAPRGAVLATNTSTLDVDEIARSTSRPESVLGMHFFSPANVMRLLEVVRAADTSHEALATAIAVGKKLRKVPVVVGVCDGFVGNRMFHAYQLEASLLLEEGALPEQVDRVMTDFGFAMGPFAVTDLAGLDVGYLIRRAGDARRDPAAPYSAIGDKLYDAGRMGQKNGKGYYLYDEKRRPSPDPEVTRLVEEHSAELGRARRDISDEEIRERLLYQLVNEGARILEEGVAQRSGDIDVVYVNGYGFPAHRGGPMFHAGQVGLPNVLAAVRRYEAEHGGHWDPAPLLVQLAEQGTTFEKAGRR